MYCPGLNILISNTSDLVLLDRKCCGCIYRPDCDADGRGVCRTADKSFDINRIAGNNTVGRTLGSDPVVVDLIYLTRIWIADRIVLNRQARKDSSCRALNRYPPT